MSVALTCFLVNLPFLCAGSCPFTVHLPREELCGQYNNMLMRVINCCCLMVVYMHPATLRLLFPQFDDVVDSGPPPLPICSSEVEQLGTPSCLSGVHTGGLTGAPNPQFSSCMLLPAPTNRSASTQLSVRRQTSFFFRSFHECIVYKAALIDEHLVGLLQCGERKRK